MTAPSVEWFAAFGCTNGERRAVRGLRHRGFEVYVPQATVWRHNRNKASRLSTPLFGSYLFVALPDTRSVWEIVSTDGVGGLVGVAGAPKALPFDWIAALRHQEARGDFDRTRRAPLTFRPGQEVVITRGPFSGVPAEVIRQASPDARVRVMLKALGGGAATFDAEALQAA